MGALPDPEKLAAASWTGRRGASRAQACHGAGEGDQHFAAPEKWLQGVHKIIIFLFLSIYFSVFILSLLRVVFI